MSGNAQLTVQDLQQRIKSLQVELVEVKDALYKILTTANDVIEHHFANNPPNLTTTPTLLAEDTGRSKESTAETPMGDLICCVFDYAHLIEYNIEE
ncbi:hypothetical protein [Heliothis virescens ascovirus 3e]|uniref:Uncharacterized protein n=1 Tax=Heliothis virescens ascovirus 3e TaxID=260797 RepID=A4KXL8_HVAVE|nr:hypothetical protein HVAV3e_gp162 [Heliothis virescens ascovirus 3e]ABO37349.1 hypothetical protein [Heliothis virescens ascovirus 3e]